MRRTRFRQSVEFRAGVLKGGNSYYGSWIGFEYNDTMSQILSKMITYRFDCIITVTLGPNEALSPDTLAV
jgi:hypothetical protein